MRVLVVDDEEHVRAVIAQALRADGHVVASAPDVAAARELAFDTDLIVLDLSLPDGSGLDLCRELRGAGATTPILMLTALTQVAWRVRGLDAGADDFLGKPFALAELRARVRALGRRGASPRGEVFGVGDVVLDFAGRKAKRAGRAVAITSREWAILDVLAKRASRLVPTADLLDGVWGEASDSAKDSLEVLIGRLRRKLGAEVIRTTRGEGYALGERKRHEA